MSCVPSELEVVSGLKTYLGNSWHCHLLWSLWSLVQQEAMPLETWTSSLRSRVVLGLRYLANGAATEWGSLNVGKYGEGGTGIVRVSTFD